MPCGATSTILVHMAFDENPDPFGLSTLTQSLSWVLGSRFSFTTPYRLALSGFGIQHHPRNEPRSSRGSDNPPKLKLRALHHCPSHVA